MNDLEVIARRLKDLDQRLRRVETTDWPGVWFFVAETVLAINQNTVTFANLPQQYRTLVLFSQVRGTGAGEFSFLYWQANGDAGNNYDRVYFNADAANNQVSAGNRATTAAYAGFGEGAGSRANNWSPAVCYWPGYALADREKWSITSANAFFGDVSVDGDVEVATAASRWRSTAAITSLVFSWGFAAGSRFTLYGIL